VGPKGLSHSSAVVTTGLSSCAGAGVGAAGGDGAFTGGFGTGGGGDGGGVSAASSGGETEAVLRFKGS